ncbi:MAG: aldo/keto reductase [Anaerotardibacter sp.]
MNMREFGKTGVKVSPLGFGMMRLPLKSGGAAHNGTKIDDVDIDTTIKMVRNAIDNGLNYIDTAFNYVAGSSEKITAKVLADGYREKVNLATKLPIWMLKEEGDFDTLLNKQLERLQTDHIDFYLVHSINANYWKRVKKYNVIEQMKKAKADGRVKFIGFSFHDDYELFEEVINSCEWDFCQIQLNYYDQEYQAGLKGMKLAASKGMGVVVMEPLRGGFLVDVPSRVQDVFDNAPVAKSNVEWALNWCWDLPEVSLVLSGMSTPEQVEQNIELAKKAEVGMMSEEEKAVIADAKAAFDSYNVIPCTGCNYCVEFCPNKIAIPYNLHAYNLQYMFDDPAVAEKFYRVDVLGYGRQASACDQCASCEAICPQHIEISNWMPQIADRFEE